jgi:hypothetical protein
MSLKIVCSGFLIRHPVGGHTWHHLQYLIGLQRLGHEVTFFEDYGWPASCYDPNQDLMTAEPHYGIQYMLEMFRPHGLADRWCYLAEDGTAYGLSREQLAESLAQADLFLNLSHGNWIPELEACRRRALVDTDPVFTQIAAAGAGTQAFAPYHALFTYGENVHKAGCTMPTAGARWMPTRQPIVLDLWEPAPVERTASFTTVLNWTPVRDQVFEGRMYGQKDRAFEPFYDLPRRCGEPMEIAVNGPGEVKQRLADGGWRLADPHLVTWNPRTYQRYLRDSRAEFCVAKHGYVASRCGWFSDRTSGYLATGRPAVVEDTGFSEFLPCGEGLIAFRTPEEAMEGMKRVSEDPQSHGRAARAVIEEHFDARGVLTHLLERCL